MVWGGFSQEGRTDLHVLNRSNLTCARYRDEILRPIVRPYTEAQSVLGFSWYRTIPDLWMCRRFLEDEGIDTIDWPARSLDLNAIEHFWYIMDQRIRWLSNPPRAVQELTNALVGVWQDIDLGTIRRLMRSMPRRLRVCIQARRGHTLLMCPFNMIVQMVAILGEIHISIITLFLDKVSGISRQMLVHIHLGQFCSVLLHLG